MLLGIVSIDVASGPAIFPSQLEAIGVSTYDLHSVRVALELLLGLKKEDGRLLYASPPFADTVSFTYHCHSLNGLALYYFYSGDLDWLSRYWNHFKLGIDYALLSVDATSLANITASSGGLHLEWVVMCVTIFLLTISQRNPMWIEIKYKQANRTRTSKPTPSSTMSSAMG